MHASANVIDSISVWDQKGEKALKFFIGAIGLKDLIIGVLVLLVWAVLFLAGIVVDSTPFRSSLSLHHDFWQTLFVWFAAFTCYTVTNILLLSCLASVLGEIGRATRLKMAGAKEPLYSSTHPYVGAVTRGFFLYLVVTSGVIVIVDSPLTTPSQQQYIRLAGLISLLSFTMSFSPQVFAHIFDRIASRLEGKAEDESKGTQKPGSDL
jgi:hypothetical protein